jgi:cell division protein FtsL
MNATVFADKRFMFQSNVIFHISYYALWVAAAQHAVRDLFQHYDSSVNEKETSANEFVLVIRKGLTT